jgi:hypothetical protein
MFHSFPRRGRNVDVNEKGLRILELVLEFGLLLTPEILTWKDHKTPPSPPEEYVQVGRPCCFSELDATEVPRHAEYFGRFALEYSHRTLIDLGAVPVVYIPTMSDFPGYGTVAALVLLVCVFVIAAPFVPRLRAAVLLDILPLWPTRASIVGSRSSLDEKPERWDASAA